MAKRVAPLLWLACLGGCVPLVGREPPRDGGPDIAAPADVAAIDTPSPFTFDVAPTRTCAQAPSGRPGVEVVDRAVTYRSAINYGFHLKGSVRDRRGGTLLYGGLAGRADGDRGFGATVIRIGPDGALDTSFGDAGRVVLDTRGDAALDDVFLNAAGDDQGRVVLVGASQSASVASRGLIARLTADGVLDETFQRVGWRHFNARAARSQSDGVALRDVALDGDRIVVVGDDAGPFRVPTIGLVAVFDERGDLDPRFARRGVFFDAERYIRGLAVRADGYVVAGTDRVETRPSLRLLDRDGHPRLEFGVRGVSVHPIDEDMFTQEILLDARGGLIVAGGLIPPSSADLESASAAIVRFGPDGAPDLAFGRAGVLRLDGNASYSYGNGHVLARHCGDQIVFATGTNRVGMPVSVYRFGLTGALDPTFGVDGVGSVASAVNPTMIVGAAGVGLDDDASLVVTIGAADNATIGLRYLAP